MLCGVQMANARRFAIFISDFDKRKGAEGRTVFFTEPTHTSTGHDDLNLRRSFSSFLTLTESSLPDINMLANALD